MTGTLDELRPETRTAIEAVRRGLHLARSGDGASEISSKGGRDIVTATDVAVEDTIRRIVEDRSTHPVIGEELGGDVPPDGAPYWLVDPICGTRNFASGIPLYCVNCALVQDDRIVVAAVGDPTSAEISFAEDGRGAWVTGDGGPWPLAAGAHSQTIIVESGHATGARREHAARAVETLTRADRWDLRNLGSSLSLAYVAAGRVAAYVLFAAPALHIGAGAMLVAEAGGTVTQLDGAPWTVASDSLIAAADPALHHELIEMIHASEEDPR